MASAGVAGGLRVLRVVRIANTRRGSAGQTRVRELCKIAGAHYPQKIGNVLPAQPIKDIDDAGSAGSETVFSTYALRDSKKGTPQDVRVRTGKVGGAFSAAVREGLETAAQYPHYPQGRSLTALDLHIPESSGAGGWKTHYPQAPDAHPHRPPRSPQAGIGRAHERPNP